MLLPVPHRLRPHYHSNRHNLCACNQQRWRDIKLSGLVRAPTATFLTALLASVTDNICRAIALHDMTSFREKLSISPLPSSALRTRRLKAPSFSLLTNK